ncbi:TPA: DJ-1 family protein [Candidatus Poribacteria bacterium]|nr:DJ-1 family protein [Candidatus Poribacteria bacterium]
MALTDKKALMVLPYRDFEDREYDIPKRMLEARGVKVTVASEHPGELRGAKGTAARADMSLDDVKYSDYDAIIFVGGNGATRYFDDEAALKLAKDAKYKILGATSNAPIILANAEVLEDKRATGHPSIVSFLRAQKAEYTGQPIEVDEKIITAQDASFAETFGNAIIQTLQK